MDLRGKSDEDGIEALDVEARPGEELVVVGGTFFDLLPCKHYIRKVNIQCS